MAVISQPALVVGQVKLPAQLTGRAAFALFHTCYAGRHDAAGAKGHQLPGIGVTDAVAQSAEHAGLGVYKGDGPDTGYAVPDPGADAPSVQLRVKSRFYRHQLFFIVPEHGEHRLFIGKLSQKSGQAFVAGDVLSVELQQNVTDAQAALPGRTVAAAIQFGKIHHHGALGKQFDAGGAPQGDQLFSYRRQVGEARRHHRRFSGDVRLRSCRHAAAGQQHRQQRRTKSRQQTAAARRKCDGF